MQPKNIKEFKELILKYESITLEEIEKHYNKLSRKFAHENLTGFGDSETCELCKKVNRDCEICTYAITPGCRRIGTCHSDDNDETFMKIADARTPQELKAAYKARAKHMRNILKEYYENNT